MGIVDKSANYLYSIETQTFPLKRHQFNWNDNTMSNISDDPTVDCLIS